MELTDKIYKEIKLINLCYQRILEKVSSIEKNINQFGQEWISNDFSCRILGYSKSSRILKTLRDNGYLHKDEDFRYHAGKRCYEYRKTKIEEMAIRIRKGENIYKYLPLKKVG